MRVGKAQRAQHSACDVAIDGGHGANAPLPPYIYARFAATMPHTAITAIDSEISTL